VYARAPTPPLHGSTAPGTFYNLQRFSEDLNHRVSVRTHLPFCPLRQAGDTVCRRLTEISDSTLSQMRAMCCARARVPVRVCLRALVRSQIKKGDMLRIVAEHDAFPQASRERAQ